MRRWWRRWRGGSRGGWDRRGGVYLVERLCYSEHRRFILKRGIGRAGREGDCNAMDGQSLPVTPETGTRDENGEGPVSPQLGSPMDSSNAPTRPALRYYGGKWLIAPWIIPFFPEHRAYLEPCVGGASVFARKRPCEVEILNDANGRLVNFFRQLRDNTAELRRRIELTPWAEDEYALCKAPAEEPVEDARRLYVASWQSVHGVGSDRSGWRWICLLYTSPSPRDRTRSRMPSSA